MVDQQPIQAAQTELCVLASIKKWVNTYYGVLADFSRTSQTYGSLFYFTRYFTSISIANKCQLNFNLGIEGFKACFVH